MLTSRNFVVNGDMFNTKEAGYIGYIARIQAQRVYTNGDVYNNVIEFNDIGSRI